MRIIIDKETGEEFEEEVHLKRNRDAQVQELLDIAVAAIWGVVSIQGEGVDW